jgi:hypothetical protein
VEIMLKDQKRVLNGRASYSLRYDDHTLGTNLAIIEAKKAGCLFRHG